MSLKPINLKWPKEQIDTLSLLWSTHSASEIGALVGKTRNSVIGKAARLNLPHKRAVTRRATGVAPRSSVRITDKPSVKKVAVPKPPLVAVPLVPGGIHIMDLAPAHCRAVIGHGDDGLARYCGAQRSQKLRTYMGKPIIGVGGQEIYEISPYCGIHSTLYYRE